jgi:hypothetical protein
MLYISEARVSYIVYYELLGREQFYQRKIEGGIITKTDNQEEIQEQLEELLVEKYFYHDHKFNQGELPEIIFTSFEVLASKETYSDFLDPEAPINSDSSIKYH